ncbi:MAG: hypothetical protein GY862_03995, partial [Gammaproteobacteria bacterium]|nr:hypothetical protein [Gammaproteobacteria bacterium]
VILWGNTAAGPGYDEFDNDGSAEIRYSLIRGSGGSGAGWNVVLGKDLGGNSDIDPLFVSPVTEAAPTVAGDLRLQPGSPAIDRGGNVSRLSGISADPDGNPRLADCNVDIGAYESPGTGAACDLTVALAGPAEATMGYPARYRLSVTNRGTGDARGITDLTLPANARLHGIEGDAEFAATLARADGILSLDVLLPANTESILTVSLIPLTTDTLIFAPGEITIDPLNRVPETDETNNALSVSVALPVSSCPSAEIIYTDSLAETERHGLTWKTALNSLADALAAAEICSEIREIHVAEGVYKPSTRTEISNPRTASFRLHNNLKIYGGYPHGGGARDWRTHRTVLSGDIDTDDITDGDGVTVSAQGMNSYHVMFSENTNAMLDGFIVTGGQATAADQPHNKVISGCSRAYYGGGHYGGGMCNYDGSPALTNIMFSGNQATYGGGMYNYKGSPALTNVMFSGNQADKMGGGMYTASSPALTNVIFNGNQAVEEGGGVYNLGASALTNVAFNGNRAGKDGGGMYNNQGTPTLINVTFSGNPAGGGMVNHGSSPHLISVILWDNFPYEMRNREYEEWYMANAGRNPYYPVWRTIPSIPKIRHSLIRGSRNGSGGWNTEFGEDLGRNLDANPLFTEDLRLLPGSPAIDAGDINAVQDVAGDLAGNPRIVGGTVDIGAYEAIFDMLSFSAAVYLQDESGRAAEISVSRNSNSPDGEVSVEYRTVPGMASEGEDYAAASGVLTWADGDIAAKTFSITVHDDVLAEQEETAGLELRNPVGNAVLGGLARAELLILDDDIAHPGTQNGAVFSLLNAAPPSPGGTEPILYQVIPAPEHTGMPADILGIAVYAAFKGQSRYSHNGRGWRPWDGDPANLGVMQRHERLAENFEIALPPVPSDIAAGEYRFYAGYRPDNGGLVLNSGNPLRLYTGNTAQGIAGSYFEPLLSIAGDRFSSRARIDLEHIGLPADILAVKLWQPLEGPASFQARNAYGRWQPWPGDLAELPAMARYESLPPLLDIDILQPSSFGFPSPGEAVVYVGYRLNDGTLIYPDRDFPRLRINKPAYRAGLRTETDFITWAYQNPAAGNPLSAPPSVPLSAEVAIRADPGHTGRQTHTGLAAVHKTADAPPPLGAWREEELVLLEITPPYSLPRIAPLPVFTWFDGDYFIYAGYSQPENDILVHSDGMLLSGE